ncbi:MAG: Tex-like N-terminal domain-containing protein, partial [Planctomycetota bacterium]
MTAQPILETLAKEFSTDVPSVQAAFEMLDAGLSAPFIGRFRRARTGAMSEVHVRRLQRRREELQELDRRRGTILRTLERAEDLPAAALDKVRGCMDRFELEDHYVPFRRPEPEVQLALDRGLGALADLIVAPVPKDKRKNTEGGGAEAAPVDGTEETRSIEAPAEGADGTPPAAPLDASPAPNDAPVSAGEEAPAPEVAAAAPTDAEPAAEPSVAVEPSTEGAEGAAPSEADAAGSGAPTEEPAAEASTEEATAPDAPAPAAESSKPAAEDSKPAADD